MSGHLNSVIGAIETERSGNFSRAERGAAGQTAIIAADSIVGGPIGLPPCHESGRRIGAHDPNANFDEIAPQHRPIIGGELQQVNARGAKGCSRAGRSVV